jgi:hypothetical protein
MVLTPPPALTEKMQRGCPADMKPTTSSEESRPD